jgi:hypothetical protein
MSSVLSKVRDLLIIVGIYLYFSSWVYVHFYYDRFGISTESIKIDYSSYLVYSYNVFTSRSILVCAAIIVFLYFVYKIARTSIENSRFLSNILSALKKNLFFFSILCLLSFFPLLFLVARSTALKDYLNDRKNPGLFRSIQFIFKKNAEFLGPLKTVDTLVTLPPVFADDIPVIKNDAAQALRLLAENNEYYYVLNQPAYDAKEKLWPRGYVYIVDKKAVLFAKLILRSTK